MLTDAGVEGIVLLGKFFNIVFLQFHINNDGAEFQRADAVSHFQFAGGVVDQLTHSGVQSLIICIFLGHPPKLSRSQGIVQAVDLNGCFIII